MNFIHEFNDGASRKIHVKLEIILYILNKNKDYLYEMEIYNHILIAGRVD